MKEERRQILDMLAQGAINTEEADRLLEKLADGAAEPETENLIDTTDAPRGRLKFLRIHVDSSDGDKVNIRIPLGLIRSGVALAAVLPGDASEKLCARGFDLNQLAHLNGEALEEALRELQIDVDSEDGDVVRIFCE